MMPSTSKVGLACVVAFEVAKQPPWSMDTSTITAPRFICFNMLRLTSLGALAPATSTAPTTTSGPEYFGLDGVERGGERAHAALEQLVELAQTWKRAIQDGD